MSGNGATAPTRQVGIPLVPWAFIGLITVPLAVAATITWYRVMGGAIILGDIDWYASALPRLLSDQPLYDPAKLLPHVAERPPFWNQAPSTALMSLIMLGPGGGLLWGLVMIGGVVVGLALVWPRVGPGGVALLAPVLLVWPPVTEALAWANVNALVFGLLAVAWRFPRAAGWAIGVASAAKLVPIIAVAWLIGKRDWRGAAVAVAILVMATVVVLAWKGFGTLPDFITLRLNERPSEGAAGGVGFAAVTGLPQTVGYLAAAVLAVLALRFASLSLAIVAMLFSVAELHLHYLTWLLIPIIGIWIPWLLGHARPQAADEQGMDPQMP